MLSNIYSYITSFYYTEPDPVSIISSTKIIDKIVETKLSEEKIEENTDVMNNCDIDEKKVYCNNFKQKQTKTLKNKKNKRKIKH